MAVCLCSGTETESGDEKPDFSPLSTERCDLVVFSSDDEASQRKKVKVDGMMFIETSHKIAFNFNAEELSVKKIYAVNLISESVATVIAQKENSECIEVLHVEPGHVK